MGKLPEIDKSRVQEWEEIYAPLDVSKEIEKMQLWLSANPKRAMKKNWARFVINWLNRAHAQVVVAAVKQRENYRNALVGSGNRTPTAEHLAECERNTREILKEHPELGQ